MWVKLVSTHGYAFLCNSDRPCSKLIGSCFVCGTDPEVLLLLRAVPSAFLNWKSSHSVVRDRLQAVSW